jgi:hypothetical protein
MNNALTGTLPPELVASSPHLRMLFWTTTGSRVRHRPAALRARACLPLLFRCKQYCALHRFGCRFGCFSSLHVGTLPPEYGQLVKLTHLSASDNGLSGAHESHGWPYAHCLCFLVCLLVKDAQDACNASASVYAGPIPPMPKLGPFTLVRTHNLAFVPCGLCQSAVDAAHAAV